MISEIQRINWFRRSIDLHHEANFVLTAIICCDSMLTESGKLVRYNVVLQYVYMYIISNIRTEKKWLFLFPS